jgi:hypothetical protein
MLEERIEHVEQMQKQIDKQPENQKESSLTDSSSTRHSKIILPIPPADTSRNINASKQCCICHRQGSTLMVLCNCCDKRAHQSCLPENSIVPFTCEDCTSRPTKRKAQTPLASDKKKLRKVHFSDCL